MTPPPEPVLSATEQAAWADLEARLVDVDTTHPTSRSSRGHRSWPIRRLGIALLTGNVFIGALAVTGFGEAALAAALVVLIAAVYTNLQRFRHRSP